MSGGRQRADGRRRVLTLHPGIRADVAARILDTLTELAENEHHTPIEVDLGQPLTVYQRERINTARRGAIPIVEPRSDGLAVYARQEVTTP